MKAKLTLLFCLFQLISISLITAQVTANFTIDNPTGCSPLPVNFTNTSAGTGTLTYNWDLGNGNTSSLKDPKAVYTTPGIYKVKLTVNNGSQTNSIEKNITVYKNPTANFSATQKGCIPINIPFSDASTKGDGNITKWNWDFRNGVTTTEQNPSNNYTSAGKYDIFLEVTDANGCKSNIEKKGFIDLVEKPTISFFPTPASSCTVPATIQFTNQTTGGGTLSYAWDFGGGATSTSKSPSHTYTAFGTYNVKLVATSDYGCSATLNVPSIVIGEVTANGSLKQGTVDIKNNDIICTGEIDYSNLSVGNANCFWDFGDGFSSYSKSGKHPYVNAGKYVIKLVAAPGDACADTVKWNITVEKASAAFTLSPESSCNKSTTVALTNQSSANIISYEWKFDDNTTSTQQNVVRTYTIPADKDQFVIHEDYSYPVTLSVTSTNGCKASVQKFFTIQQPTALFSASTIKGCAPLTVNFTDRSVSNDQITTREWNWGEGTPQSSPISNISHTYNTPGIYPVEMIVNTINGCKDNSYILNIQVGSTLVPDFQAVTPTICSSQNIQFTDKSPVGNITRWHYSINGIGAPVCSDNSNPLFKMKVDTGVLPVKLMVEYNGCFSEVTKNTAVTNDGPLGNFDFAMNCSVARSVAFKATTKKAVSFLWDFGDSQTNSTDLNITHVYAAEGNYTVKFITLNGLCSDTVIRVVKVRDHQPSFTLKAETCAATKVYFNSKASHKLSDSCKEKYLWNFGDSSQMVRTDKDSVSHEFTKGGTFQVKVFAFYDNGCVDSIAKPIRVFKPKAGFTVDKAVGCAPLPVTFTDISVPDVHPIVFWSWDFGDGNSSTYTSQLPSLMNTYGYPSEYNAVLNVSDDFGCSASFEKLIGAATPSAVFSATTSTQICAGTEVSFLYDYIDPDSAIWNFGNGHIIRSKLKPTKFTFQDTGKHTISLTIFKFGCSDNFSYSDYIQVQKADARFTVSDTAFNCYPKLINFNHTAGNKNIQNGRWIYGQGNNSSPGYVPSTSYNYTEPGIFNAKLQIETSFGCADTFNRSIKITGPVGFFEVTPKQACKGDNITFTMVDTANVFSFEWDLGDGNFSTQNPVIHKYGSVGNKTSRLILYGDKGKCIPPPVEQSVYVYEVIAGITLADTSVCEGTDILFASGSTGASIFAWNFGDGVTSAIESPTHKLAIGTFNASLIVTNAQGCKDTAVQAIVVHPLPNLIVSNDTTICAGGSALLKAITNSNAIRWEPNNSLSSANIKNPIANPAQTIAYKAIAIDTISRCERRDSVQIVVQPEPEVEMIVESSNVVSGRPVQLAANTEPGATFDWSPAELVSCKNCFNPITTPRANANYVLLVTDKNKCFTVKKEFTITVDKGAKAFDVPTAFTPGGDAKNSIFKVEGYNVKQLLEFKIYNRWGNLVFSSNDLSKGWDGMYQGKAQPIDSYVYTIKIETFDGEIESKTGTVLLLR